MIDYIVYKSNAGHTKAYAQMLGKELNLPVYELDEAISNLVSLSKIIFLGWLMNGRIKGYKKANRHFRVKCICAVGITSNEKQLKEIRISNKLVEDLPLFILQGGFEFDKLTGIYKLMMSTMKNISDKDLANKTNEEKEILKLFTNDGNEVSIDKLVPVIKWFKKEGN